MIYCLISLAIIILDRVVKHAVSSGMSPGESIALINDFFSITYIRNTGAAFSIMSGQRVFLVAFTAAAVGICVFFMVRNRKKWNRSLLTGMAFVCGGGAGNLIDRASYGYVVDMFDVSFFAVFNVADIFVCVGCGLIILSMFLSGKEDGEKKGTKKKDE